MIDPRWEEQAALHAVGLLEEQGELEREVSRDPEIARLVRDFSVTASLLAYDAPQVAPPGQLKRRIMDRLDAPERGIIPFRLPSIPLGVPYALAACLAILALVQTGLLVHLNSRLGAEHLARMRLQESDSMLELRLADLQAKDTNYINAKVMVAWDPIEHRGMISMDNLPAPPPGHDYQLWVLDPTAPAPMSAGLLTRNARAQDFAAHPVRSMGPGFAISMEPAGGNSSPNPGPILFAVAPGQ